MARSPHKTCPNLFRLFEDAEDGLLQSFLGQDEFQHQGWLNVYLSTRDEPEARFAPTTMLQRETKSRLKPLDQEAARILTVAEPRGEFALSGLARAKLPSPAHDLFRTQRDTIARSLWTYINHRLVFEAAETALHLRLYRQYGKHYQSFMALPARERGADDPRCSLDRMIEDVTDRLDLGSGCTVERFDLPRHKDYPPSEMYIIFHPNPPTSAREIRDDGERRTIYFRPPGEATIVFTPSTGIIEVRADTRVARRQVAESFAEQMLGQDLSSKPLDYREYDLSRFFNGFMLDCPDMPDAMVKAAKVIKAEISVRQFADRLSVATTIDRSLDDLIASQQGLRGIFCRAIAVRFIGIAVRYVPAGEKAERGFDFTISDQNSCSLLSQPDERDRVLGHHLMRHWGILNELRTLAPEEASLALPVMLDIWALGTEDISGSWLAERQFDPAVLTAGGFLEPAGWEDVDLVDDEDALGMSEAKVIAEQAKVFTAHSEGQEGFAGSSERYRRFRVNHEWLFEYLSNALSQGIDDPFVARLSPDLIALGGLTIDARRVPVYLARRLDDEKVLGTSDAILRGRGDHGLGMVLHAGSLELRCIAANVLSPVRQHLAGSDAGPELNVETVRMAFRSNRSLARGGQNVELVWRHGAIGELFVPEKGSIQIPGEVRLKIIKRLVEAHRHGAATVKTSDLIRGLAESSLQNIFGKSLWQRLNEKFIRSAGHGLWEIAS